MKIGKNYQKVKAALKEAYLFNRAWSVHYATMENQKVLKNYFITPHLYNR